MLKCKLNTENSAAGVSDNIMCVTVPDRCEIIGIQMESIVALRHKRLDRVRVFEDVL